MPIVALTKVDLLARFADEYTCAAADERLDLHRGSLKLLSEHCSTARLADRIGQAGWSQPFANWFAGEIARHGESLALVYHYNLYTMHSGEPQSQAVAPLTVQKRPARVFEPTPKAKLDTQNARRSGRSKKPNPDRWLVFGLVVALAMFLYPPTGEPTEYGRLGYYKYMPIWDIEGSRSIDYTRLLIQFGFTAAVACYNGIWKPRRVDVSRAQPDTES